MSPPRWIGRGRGSRRASPRCSARRDWRLHDDAIATLTARTEGWAAGLQLAALSLRDQSDVAAFVETFSGSHRYVLDYLTEEVLERQPEPVLAFLLETSVLDRLSGQVAPRLRGDATRVSTFG